MHPMKEKKEQLKDMARHIRSLKLARKTDKHSNYTIWRAGWDFRHEHIAYCLVRGRTYDQIEKPSEFNKPSKSKIESLYNTLKAKVDRANSEYALTHNNVQQLEVSNG